jgi:hypothetical protein
MSMNGTLTAGVLATLLGAFALAGPLPPDPASDRVSDVKTCSAGSGVLVIELVDGRSLHQIAKMTWFSPFRPGMTIAEAKNFLGEPLSERRDFRGSFYRYQGKHGALEVARLSSSSTFGDEWVDWSVYLYPDNGRLDEFLADSLRPCLARFPRANQILVISGNRGFDERLDIKVADGVVREVRWFRVPK